MFPALVEAAVKVANGPGQCGVPHNRKNLMELTKEEYEGLAKAVEDTTAEYKAKAPTAAAAMESVL